MLETFLETNQIQAQILQFDQDVATSDQAAGLEKTHPVVKSILLCVGEKDFVLAVLEATRKVSLNKVRALTGEKNIRLATAEEVEQVTGYPVGGVPPISIYGVKTYIDPRIQDHAWVVCGGGTKRALLKIQSADIIEWAFEPQIVDVSE